MKCANCGFDPDNTITHKPLTHSMNEYVDKAGKVDGCYNSEDDTIIINGVTLLKKSFYERQKAIAEAAKKIAPTPTPTGGPLPGKEPPTK